MVLGLFGVSLARAGIGLWSIAAVVAAAGLGYVGRHLSRTSRKQRAVASAFVAAANGPHPVLYLRSFADDEEVADANSTLGFYQLTTEEEQLATVLNRIGPFTAIGDPSEALPDLGAARIYVGDGEWQDRVVGLLASARLVVLRLSSTQGVRWELRQAVSIVGPERLLLLIPKGRRRYSKVRQNWDELSMKPLPNAPLSLTRFGSLQGIIWFANDWTPEFLRWPGFHSLRASLRAPIAHRFDYMLRPVFNRLDLGWRKPPVTSYGVAANAVGLAFVVAAVVSAGVG